MTFEWDPAKAAANLAKHRIDFADITSVFEDPRALTVDDPDPDEERYVTIGLNTLGQLTVAVYTWRGDTIRIISARPATRRETTQYEAT